MTQEKSCVKWDAQIEARLNPLDVKLADVLHALKKHIGGWGNKLGWSDHQEGE